MDAKKSSCQKNLAIIFLDIKITGLIIDLKTKRA